MYQRIRNLREDSDLKQAYIAQYLWCDQSLYSKYERGERVVPVEVLEKLAIYYEISVDYLIGLTDERAPYR